MTAGRPDEGRVRMNVHVLPATAMAINQLVDKENSESNTQGKVIDQKFAMKRGKWKRGARRHGSEGCSPSKDG